MKCLVSKQDLKLYSILYWKPVQLLKNWRNVLIKRCSGKNTSCRVLNQLELMKQFSGNTSEKGITVVYT